MKRIFAPILFAIVLLTFCKTSFAATWYVRADGGTRYSNNASQGQCDGLADAAYPGTGVNQHCAFNDARFLWDDQHSYNQLQWVIAGGDTVILDNTKQWRIGWDGDGTNQSAEPWCPGWSGGPYACINPNIPAGTATQHTRILGRNYASCSVGNQPDKTKMTQIFGGHGIYEALNLNGAQFVDVECIEIARHSNCIQHGAPAVPSYCSSNVPIDDYDSDGITTDTGSHDLLLQDLWIHGHPDRGIKGPIGGTVTANRIDIDTNGEAGWDFDNGQATPSVNGNLVMTYSTIEWSGCNQEYPAVDTIPVASCYSQSTGGYGDGIGTPGGTPLNVTIDHDVFRYNTQDGEDFGHIDTGSSTLSITNSASYGNNGGQFKWGPAFSTVIFENNIAVGNCLRMSQPMTGLPSSYNANLGDFCRAYDALSFVFYNGVNATLANNTIVSYAPTTIDMACGTQGSTQNCSNTVFNIKNNIFRGYDNPTTYSMGGQSGGPGLYCGPGCDGSTALIGTINRANNIYFGIRGSCQANELSYALKGSAVNESCVDPQLVNEPGSLTNEATLDALNFSLGAASPALGAGVTLSGLSDDFDSKTRLTPTSIGALENGSTALLADIMSGVLGSVPTPAPIPVTPTVPLAPAVPPVAPPTQPTTPTLPTQPVVPTQPTQPVVPTQPTQPTTPSNPAPTQPIVPTKPTQKAVGTTILLTGQNYTKVTQTVTITATVRAVSGTAIPTGTVTLVSKGIKVGTATLSARGVATWSLPAAVEFAGATAQYAGATSFTASTSSTVTIYPPGTVLAGILPSLGGK